VIMVWIAISTVLVYCDIDSAIASASVIASYIDGGIGNDIDSASDSGSYIGSGMYSASGSGSGRYSGIESYSGRYMSR